MLIIDFLSNSWTDIKYATARGSSPKISNGTIAFPVLDKVS